MVAYIQLCTTCIKPILVDTYSAENDNSLSYMLSVVSWKMCQKVELSPLWIELVSMIF